MKASSRQSPAQYATEIRDIPYGLLVPAPWNYKPDAPPDVMERLMNSIKHDRSAGVLAVRHLPKGKFEVLDGNHRYEVLGPGWLNWDPVRCEDFGKISLAQAISIAHRRNHQWFDPDLTALSGLLKKEVVKEIPREVLAGIFPEGQKAFDGLLALSEFDWQSLPPGTQTTRGADFIFSVEADQEMLACWKAWEEIAKEKYQCTTKAQSFLKALQLATEASR